MAKSEYSVRSSLIVSTVGEGMGTMPTHLAVFTYGDSIGSRRTPSDCRGRRDHHLRSVDFDHHLDLHRNIKRQFGHPNGGACVTPNLVTEQVDQQV